ncbi:flagellar biosynthesis protein FlgN, partial [Enterobacter hormaechei subsp. steigerwaltii]|jgi:flagellar biosynthesis protein FlgN
VLKPYKEPGLYGADGQTATARITGGKKISI